MGDVYRNAKILFVVIFVLNALGVIAVLMIFVHAQTSGQPVVMLGFELPSDPERGTLTLSGSAVLLPSLATGSASYLAEVMSFRLAREAMDRAVDRILAVVGAGLPDLRSAVGHAQSRDCERLARIRGSPGSQAGNGSRTVRTPTKRVVSLIDLVFSMKSGLSRERRVFTGC